MDLFTSQFFIGVVVGAVFLIIYFVIFKPFVTAWQKVRIIALNKANKELVVKLRAINKGEEIIFEHWQKAEAELKFIKERLRSVTKINVELGDTISALSKEKSALQDERAVLFIKCDALNSRLVKLTSPAYGNSGKVITKEGKLK